jgi:hypothetical protein
MWRLSGFAPDIDASDGQLQQVFLMSESGGRCNLWPYGPVQMSAKVAELADPRRAELLSVDADFKGDHLVNAETASMSHGRQPPLAHELGLTETAVSR